MSKNDFSDLGDQIKDIVQGAVKNMDFEKLNRDISGTVGRALDEVKENLGIQYQNQPHTRYRYRGTSGQNTRYQNWNAEQSQRGSYYYNGTRQPQPNRMVPRPIFGKAKGAVAGILATIFGGIGTFAFGISELSIAASAAAGYIGGGPTLVSMTVLAPFFLGSAAALAAGIRMNSRTGRFKRYLYRIGQASFITMEELSASTGKSLDYVRKDVRKMIEDGMFPCGHIDPEGKYLILNDETYRLYQATRVQQMEMKQREERDQAAREREKKEKEKDDKLSKVMEIGEEYARQLKEANMAMSEKEISLKLTRLEMVIRKIFQCVELNPEKLPDIEKFTEYYLPTTLKLVNTYRDFDKEPIQGDNIKKAKEEISQTLNTIIQAFENLLDSMYEDVAMDISTDISVLETMLKQEGLTDSEFEQMREKESM
ncbi:MAG: 5-bromo-4-chloroindolyl phosphate hydrolysis family protein [Lachnospiraceae bacterium]|nr:5-bromo-4-chloroindolyl phosphate hydrolysis family protein [Candidatus Fimimorpha excrementavium]